MPKEAHILLIEDSATDAELLKQAFYQMEKTMILHHVPDVVGALSFLSKKGRFTSVPDPDVILLDLSLPNIPGIEALRIIKETQQWKHLPVVVQTGLDDRREHQRCVELGATAVWEKPPNGDAYRHLVHIIRECVEDHAATATWLKDHVAER